ncbi:MAG: hypothetical protein M3460_10810 [Actinomycetota bacterium]|nr:hypothetical protein [Actinomycetota bacterium]
MTPASAGHPGRPGHRRVIHASCLLHGGARGYTNLVVRKLGEAIELDPHVTGACVLTLNEAAATELFDALGEWLG